MSLRIAVADSLDAPHALRRAVFIDEQAIPEAEEWDDLDEGALHLVAWDGDRVVGTARLVVEGDTGRIGRVCVLPSHRGTGLGAALIRDGMARLAAQGLGRASLSAQVRAQGFYEGLGFAAQGDTYDDAGIPHVTMSRALPAAGGDAPPA